MVGSLPPRPSGSGAQAQFMQWVWDKLSGQDAVQGGGTAVSASRTTRGVMLEGLGDPNTVTTRKYILKDAEAANYLICRPWDSNYWTSRRDLRTELGHAPTNAEIAARMALTEPGVLEAHVAEYLEREIIVAKAPDLRADDLDGQEIDVDVEAWDGVDLTVSTKTYTFEYPSALLRVKTDIDDEDNPETQAIIPRFVPELTIIHAIFSNRIEISIDGNSIRLVDQNLAGRAWAKIE